MNNDISRAYENLANEILIQAINDVVMWRLACKNDKLTTEIEYNGRQALSFLTDEKRVSIFTSFSVKDIEAIIERRIKDVENGNARRFWHSPRLIV